MKRLVPIAVVIWLTVVGTGLFFLWGYENKPGPGAKAPTQWPHSTQLSLDTVVPTLVMAIHPHCPCSRATISELAVLMTRSRNLVKTQVLFVKPTGFNDDWEKTDLWRSATMIPGVNVSVDNDGQEAGRFGSQTSGQVVLYSPQGHLLFSGGITGSRGHAGDNEGRSAMESLLTSGTAERTETPVFGCSLFTKNSKSIVEESCNAHIGN
ncbi:MAG TPA: hypothetical protein VMS31_03085 [Pyrinomonadaceae bacterium]|nr:hypothetical protein [Pyrinomonadaceae bacterium]